MKHLCVYCGSSAGRAELYAHGARQLARVMIERNIGLVYGGASVGVMGIVADELLRLGGQVIGVIPEALMRKEIAHDRLTRLIVTASMHERKSRMAELADGFVALPGGIGTLEELFEIWTWAQLGIHRKPVGLLNLGGYFDHLLKFIATMQAEGFVKSRHLNLLTVATSPGELFDRFDAYAPADEPKWLTPAELPTPVV